VKTFHASWVVPVDGPPIRDGFVATGHGRIVAVGKRTRATAPDAGAEIDLGHVAVLPGLVNAHTHLELSWMRGAVPGGGPFTDWIRRLLAARRQGPPGGEDERRESVTRAIAECRRTGTALVGDVANTLETIGPLAAGGLHAVVFRELIGFHARAATELVDRALNEHAATSVPAGVRLALAAHAPYSVSPALFQGIRRALAREPFLPSSVHLGESAEEVEFLRHGVGPWRVLLEELGVWDERCVPPACDPVEYLARIGFLDERLLCVHGVHLTRAALERLARRRVTMVTCPRGNRLTGAGTPPVAEPTAWQACPT
jgi:cytosine/adenosine deaminase-related metal-dependent hydrolase